MRKFPFPLPTVGALIFNKGDLFLVKTHKWKNTFGIPGGKIHHGETMINAVKREILEETNLKIKKIEFAMIQENIRSKEFYKKDQHFLLINYFAQSVSRKFILNDEAQHGIWIKPKEALKLKLNEPTRKLINFYLNK